MRPPHGHKKGLQESLQHERGSQDAHRQCSQRIIPSRTAKPLHGVLVHDVLIVDETPDAALQQYHRLEHAYQQCMHIVGHHFHAANGWILK